MKTCKCCKEPIPEGEEWEVSDFTTDEKITYYLCADCNELLADMGDR